MMCPKNEERIKELYREYGKKEYDESQRRCILQSIQGIKEGAENERREFADWLEQNINVDNWENNSVYDVLQKIKELEGQHG